MDKVAKARELMASPHSPEVGQEMDKLFLEIGRELIDKAAQDPDLFKVDGDKVTIPVDVLNQLMIGFEAGWSADEHSRNVGSLFANGNQPEQTHSEVRACALLKTFDAS